MKKKPKVVTTTIEFVVGYDLGQPIIHKIVIEEEV